MYSVWIFVFSVILCGFGYWCKTQIGDIQGMNIFNYALQTNVPVKSLVFIIASPIINIIGALMWIVNTGLVLSIYLEELIEIEGWKIRYLLLSVILGVLFALTPVISYGYIVGHDLSLSFAIALVNFAVYHYWANYERQHRWY